MADKPIVGFVGKPFKDFLNWLQDHGYEVHLYQDKRESYPAVEGFLETKKLDFSSEETLKADVSLISEKPQCLVCTYENAVPQKALLAKVLGLPGPTPQAALIATDKFEMRTCFQKFCPQFSPQFALVTNWEEVQAFLNKPGVQFPLILKPANLFKSLLVTKNNSVEELQKNFEEGLNLIEKIYKKENVLYQPRFVLEEYLDGPSYSIEVFTDKDGNAVAAPSPVDLVMGRDIGINDNYNYSRKLPSQLSTEQQEQIKKAAIAGVKAIGLTSSPAHVELVYTKTGPKLIEIGARTGGYRSRMHLLSQGVDLYQAQIDVAQGKLPTLTATKNDYCAVYEIFALEEGHLKEITHLEEFSHFSTLFYLNQKVKVGEQTGPSSKGYRFAVVVIFTTSDREQFLKDTQYFEDNVKVLLQ